MAGFEESGLPGKKSISEGFGTCEDPASFISVFQQENCVLLPSLHSALPLLDLHAVSRFSFHASLLEVLRESLYKQITLCSKEKLKDLLEHIFRFIHVDELRPVILAVMKEVPNINSDFIDKVAENNLYYQECPVEVKRQVWLRKHPLYGDAIGPLLNEYINEKYSSLHSTDQSPSKAFFSSSPRQRRQHRVIKEILTCIGKSVELYNLFLQFLRTLYLRTQEAHYCSLRAEILMACHDVDIAEIRNVDPCHKFTWCLDACIREKSVDSKRLKELQLFLDGIKKGEEEVMGDVAMITCDPFAVNAFAESILTQMARIVRMESLPRTSPDIIFLVRMLSLSSNAWEMLNKQKFKEIPVNNDVVIKFLPMLASLMLEEHFYVEAEKNEKNSWKLHVPAGFWKFIEENYIAQLLSWYHILYLVNHQKRYLLETLLPQYAENCQKMPVNDFLLGLAVNTLSKHAEEFQNNDFTHLIFEDFFFMWLPQEQVLYHCLRLLWFVHDKIEGSRLVSLLTTAQPTSEHSEGVHQLHIRLVDSVASSKISTPPSLEQPNSLSPVISPGSIENVPA